MDSKYTRTSVMAGIPGLFLQLSCYGLIMALPNEHVPEPPEWLAYVLLGGVILGSALLIVALCDFARAKGYSGFLGILGSLSCVGLLILILLPDRMQK